MVQGEKEDLHLEMLLFKSDPEELDFRTALNDSEEEQDNKM